jgi:tRNA A-37 threonylcarbamoyl transferase component Bud32
VTEETIFLAALEQATPADRAAYLDAACAGDPALRERVEALLRSHADPDSFLDRPAIARQAEAKAESQCTTDLPADAAKGVAHESVADDELLACLAPSGEPGTLGRLDHYEVLEVVGRGGMGVVFKARDTRLQRIVAIKVLAAHLAASGTARQRFFREARAAAAVRDEHVVSIHAVSDESGPTPYLVMEFISGVTLEKRNKERGALAVKEILRIGMQAAEGLASAHRQGLIHRDVKPANILLENGVERVKITDFGLARAADDASLSQSGMIAGTPLFMSPEQARGETLDPRSDLFSLGSVLYMLCTGRAAFAAGNTMAVLKRVCEETPRPIREVNPDIPDWLAAVVDRLLTKEPGERFQSAGELAGVLGQHLAQLQQSRPTQTPVPEKQEAVPPAAAPEQPAARKRKLLMLSAGLLGLVGLVAGLATIMALNRPPGPGAPPNQRPQPPDDPGVLTVSKKPEDGGRFRTIQKALDEVAPGMTIRVLDDEVYDEYLIITAQHSGVVLEATGKASLRRLSTKTAAVWIGGVSGFTLRGFRIVSPLDEHHYAQVGISGRCPGVVLDGLDMMSGGRDCVDLYDKAEGTKDAPIVIQNCTMREGDVGVILEGRARENCDHPLPCGHVVIRDNTLRRCKNGVHLRGAVHQVHVVGNRFLDTSWSAIDLNDLLEGAADILVANNTMLRCDAAVGIWDDHARGKDFLKCKNIRVQNNLVFETLFPADLTFNNHRRETGNSIGPPDLKGLLNSSEWRFGYNWRGVDCVNAKARYPDRFIPFRPTDNQMPPNAVLSQKLGDPNFLRPPKDSPLAWSGAGGHTLPAARIASAVGQAASGAHPWMASWAVAQTRSQPDRSLPAYVGAVPPEGVEPWDWQKTWSELSR